MKYHYKVEGRIATNGDGTIRYFDNREEVESLIRRFGGEVVEGELITLEQIQEELCCLRERVDKLEGKDG